jgi:uncharacterized protein YodC (DUF2158 family)
MADQFQPGATVCLKSGGPRMTVVQYGDYQMHGHRCQCKWWDEKKKEFTTGLFTDAELASDEGGGASFDVV